ncbi:MAG: hypothetical protein ABSE63_18495 [Thermoguttaceae bacterium]
MDYEPGVVLVLKQRYHNEENEPLSLLAEQCLMRSNRADAKKRPRESNSILTIRRKMQRDRPLPIRHLQ